MIRWAVLAILAAGAAGAEDGPPMGATEFQAFTEGFTLHFNRADGSWMGSETFHRNRATTWVTSEGGCLPGIWQPDRGRICFYYPLGDYACWLVYRTGPETITALSANDGEAEGAYSAIMTRKDKVPLSCEDPSAS